MQDEWVVYLRKSNGRKAIARQRSITGAMIGEGGGIIIATFSDADRTAHQRAGEDRPEREGFDAMLALLRRRRGLRVGAWHVDRLTRGEDDTAALNRVCAANGHIVVTPTGGIYDLSSPSGRKRLRDDASDAIFEVDHLIERVTAGRDDVAADGRWLGGKRPFGWEPDPRPLRDGEPWLDDDGKPVRGILRLVPAEADAVRQACADIIAGTPAYAVAKRWNAAGMTGPLGARWDGTAIRRVLARARNAGLLQRNGTLSPACWPAIVDEGTWRQVCRMFADPSRRLNGGQPRRLLSGIARCGTCGTGLVSAGGRDAYRCGRSGDGRRHVTRDAGMLDEFITATVIERFRQDDAGSLLLDGRESGLPVLEAARGELERAMKASHGQKLEGLLTPGEFAEERRRHNARLEELKGAIAAARQADVLAPMAHDPGAVWEAADLARRRAFISALMTVTVMPSRRRPAGWRMGDRWFDASPETIIIGWLRG